MYRSEWVVARDTDSVASDVEIVTASYWRKLAGPVGLPDGTPVFVPGSGDKTSVVVVPEEATVRKTQRIFRDAGRLAAKLKPGTVAIRVNGIPASLVRSALWGTARGLYQFKAIDVVQGPTMVVVSDQDLSMELEIIHQQSLVRDLINCPSNLKPPERLAELIQHEGSHNIQWSLYDESALKDMGAGGILAVGQGSIRPPVMLVGRYEAQPGAPWLALVGKGVIFDSGGISLKPGDGMGRMKGDMGGAAAVAGALNAIAALKLSVNVLGVLPMAENLPGGASYRPGDILTMMDGTEVEVISTDAEGRLLLGDGVTWAVRHGASAVVDIATLTGANVVALGGIRSALVSTDPALADLVRRAADRAGEPTWELPHDPDYADFNKTSAGDIKNSGGRPAGTITAALFVGHFAQTARWAHLDIAGLAFEAEGSNIGAGAVGYGVATLVETARAYGESSD